MNTKLKTSKYSLCVNSCMHVYCVLQVHNVNSHVSPDMVLQAEHWGMSHQTWCSRLSIGACLTRHGAPGWALGQPLNSTQSVAANVGPWQLTWVWCNWCQYWLSLLVLCYVLVMWVAFVFRVLLAVSMFGSLGQKFCHCVYNLCWLKCNT